VVTTLAIEGRIAQISVSAGGVPKRAVDAGTVTALGLEGDAHRNLEHHGGPERALCLFSLERIRELQAEGHTVVPGAMGENVTVEGLDWDRVEPGARLALGDAVLIEVTRYTVPCFNIAPFFRERDFRRVSQKRHPGSSRVYARVLRTGAIRTGDPVRLLPPAQAALDQTAPDRSAAGQVAPDRAVAGRRASGS
jgi:MOSC domain-containing protein YiiM